MKNNVYLYVFDTMADWEVAYLTAELASARYFKKGQPPLKVITAGKEKSPIVTMGGLTIMPDTDLAGVDLGQAAALILPGGDTWHMSQHGAALALAEQALAAGVVTAAVCGATLGLAGIGMLDQRYHTSNDLSYLQACCPVYRGEAYYRQEPAVTDGNLITASGLAPLDFTAHIIRALDVFMPEVLDAWYGLNKTQLPEHFFTLMRLTQ